MELNNPQEKIINVVQFPLPVESIFITTDYINNFVEQNFTTIRSKVIEQWPNATFDDYKFSCKELFYDRRACGSPLSAMVIVDLLPEAQRKLEKALLEYYRDKQQQTYP